MYVPALTGAFVTAALPVTPSIGFGPAACNVHAVGRAVPPLSLVTVFTNVSCAACVIVVDRARRRLPPSGTRDRCAGQRSAGARPGRRGIAGGTTGLGQRVGARTHRRVRHRRVPVAPLIVVGPVACNVHAVGNAVPPLSFVTVFTNVNCAATSSLLIVQVADSPNAQRDRGPRQRSTHTRPRRAAVTRRATGLRQRVASRAHRRVRHRRTDPWHRRSASAPPPCRVHAVGTAVPPLSLVTVFTNVNVRRLVVVVDRARRD